MAWKRVAGLDTKLVAVKEYPGVSSSPVHVNKVRLRAAPWDREKKQVEAPLEEWRTRTGTGYGGRTASPYNW